MQATAQDATRDSGKSARLVRMIGTLAPTTIPARCAPPKYSSCLASMLPDSRSGTSRMSASPATGDVSRFTRAASFAHRSIEGQRSIKNRPCNLAAVRLLTHRVRIDRRYDLWIYRLNRRHYGVHGNRHTIQVGQVDGVLHNVDIVFKIGVDIDRGIGDQQSPVIKRSFQNKDMADSASGPQAALFLQDVFHQEIGMQTALHQASAAPDRQSSVQWTAASCSEETSSISYEARLLRPAAMARISRSGPTSIGLISPASAASISAGERYFAARPTNRDRNWLPPLALADQQDKKIGSLRAGQMARALDRLPCTMESITSPVSPPYCVFTAVYRDAGHCRIGRKGSSLGNNDRYPSRDYLIAFQPNRGYVGLVANDGFATIKLRHPSFSDPVRGLAAKGHTGEQWFHQDSPPCARMPCSNASDLPATRARVYNRPIERWRRRKGR